MSIEAIAALVPDDEVAPLVALSAPQSASVSELPFARQLAQGIQALDTTLQQGQTELQALALGQGRPLHEVMLRLEEGRIALSFALQVRNRALEAYQDLLRMQV